MTYRKKIIKVGNKIKINKGNTKKKYLKNETPDFFESTQATII